MAEGSSYKFFDHTGDYGVEIRAQDVEGALAAVARAFLDLLTGQPDAVQEAEEREVEVEGIDGTDVLVNFANELLYQFEGEGFLCARFEADEVADDYIAGVLHGEPFDPTRHPIARPIKAATYHQAELREDADGVFARLIFDL